jgi:HEPN domain-containing protein
MLLADLKKMSRAKLKDAQLLYRQRRYDSAFYLCGYAVEIALKARIRRTLRWPEYRHSHPYQSFKTHDLQHLLGLSGLELKIKNQLPGNGRLPVSGTSSVAMSPSVLPRK